MLLQALDKDHIGHMTNSANMAFTEDQTSNLVAEAEEALTEVSDVILSHGPPGMLIIA